MFTSVVIWSDRTAFEVLALGAEVGVPFSWGCAEPPVLID